MNNEVITTLPQSSDVQGQYAVLARLDAQGAWKFLVMPSEINYERAATYSSTNAPGTATPSVQYQNTEGWTMTVSNLPLSGVALRRSLTKYVEDIAALQMPPSGQFSPSVLAFRWGNRLFSPCVLTNFAKTESLWFKDGDLAECKISFSLLQIPDSQVVKTS